MKIFNPTVSGSIILPTGSAPVTSSGFAYIYAKTDGKVYLTPAGGTEAQVGGAGGGGFTFYDVTLADAENTTNTVNVAKITVPANTWADGQIITIDLIHEFNNETFQTQTVTVNTKVRTTDYNNAIGSWSAFLGGRQFVRTTLVRNGSNVYVNGNLWGETLNHSYPQDTTMIVYPGSSNSNSRIPNNIETFGTDMDITIQITFANANPSLYLRPINGTAYKTEKGASL